MKFAVVGGDRRQLYLSDYLAKQGHNVYAYGIVENEISTDIVFCDRLSCTLEDADAVILPIPVTNDGVNIFAPDFFEYIHIADIVKFRPRLVFGGLISEKLGQTLQMADIKYYDYYTDELLTQKNAELTAEATIGVIHNTSNLALADSSVLICGYGRIGKALADYIYNITENLTVSARKTKDFEKIKAKKINSIDTNSMSNYCNQFDIIVNTVPHLIFDESTLKKCRKSVKIIDLATGGGTDFNAANDLGIAATLASGLPGKLLPVSAGYAVGNSILRYINRGESDIE